MSSEPETKVERIRDSCNAEAPLSRLAINPPSLFGLLALTGLPKAARRVLSKIDLNLAHPVMLESFANFPIVPTLEP